MKSLLTLPYFLFNKSPVMPSPKLIFRLSFPPIVAFVTGGSFLSNFVWETIEEQTLLRQRIKSCKNLQFMPCFRRRKNLGTLHWGSEGLGQRKRCKIVRKPNKGKINGHGLSRRRKGTVSLSNGSERVISDVYFNSF